MAEDKPMIVKMEKPTVMPIPPTIEKVPFHREPYKLPDGGAKYFRDITDRVGQQMHDDAEKRREKWKKEEEEWADAGFIEALPPYQRQFFKWFTHEPQDWAEWVLWGLWSFSLGVISVFGMPVGMLFFLLEESCQAMGMGLWIAYQSKKYTVCKKLLKTYIKFVDMCTIIVDRLWFLCPLMSFGVKIYFIAADEQAQAFTEVMTEVSSTDIDFKEKYFKDMPAKIIIGSTPTHTKIYIDDRYTRRSTPETMYNVIPGREYHIKVEYEDPEIGLIKSITRTITALEGEEKHIKFNLRPLIKAREEEIILMPPSLTINSTPDGARIILDGVDTGKKTDYTFEDIAPGEHHIRLEYYVKEKEKTAVLETTIKLEEWERRTERFDLTWEIRAL